MLALGILLLALGWTVLRGQSAPPELSARIDLVKALSDEAGEFAAVTPGRRFSFPADHGEHPEFKTEWWYFTGSLKDGEGRDYGYQLTFFRSGVARPEHPAAGSAWAPSDIMMGHFAVSDAEGQGFFPFERFARRAVGLSGVTLEGGKVSVWLEDWRMERSPSGGWSLRASETLPDGRPLVLELALEESKPPVLQGADGYSRKGPLPEQASYYVALTRLASRGVLTLGQRRLEVSGSSWYDHEWSSSPLAPGLVGWDWFSLQLDDGWELMVYLLRHEDGRLEAASSGSLIAPDGTKSALSLSEFRVEVKEHHRSPRGVEYPSRWTIRVPGRGLDLQLKPRLLDQEMSSGVPYWEGAVMLEGSRDGKPVTGSGFVEMTGYDKTTGEPGASR